MRPCGLSRSGVPRNSIGSDSEESPVGQEKERMKDFESLAHVRWECKYYVIFIPKYRRKVIYGKLRASIGGHRRRRQETPAGIAELHDSTLTAAIDRASV